MTLTDSLQYAHEMQHLIAQCDKESLQMSSELQEQHKIVSDINDRLHPPESVNAVFELFIFEKDRHFRWTYYNPFDPVVRFFAEMDNWTNHRK